MDIQTAGVHAPPADLLAQPDDLVLDLLPAAVYMCDRLGRIVRYNRQAVELWGRSPQSGESDERFCGAHRLFGSDGQIVPHNRSPMAEVLQSGQAVRGREVQIERPDHSRIWALVNIAPLFDQNGEVLGAINCFQDITERKLAEQKARESERAVIASERRWRELLEALPAAVYTTDANGSLTFYNAAAAALWGYQPVPGETSWCGSLQLFWPDGRPMRHDECPMATSLTSGVPVTGEAVLERPDGSRIPFAASPTPLRDETGTVTGAINMLVDISRHKQAEERQNLLINELNHRVKNTLATVQSLVTQTLRHSTSAEAFRETFGARLQALSRAHDLLTTGNWEKAGLRSIVLHELAPHGIEGEGPIEVDGAELYLPPRTALTLSMAFHELTTNAVKYGALSVLTGRLKVTWSIAHVDGPGQHLEILWVEHGGPPVSPPSRRGFGSRLVERSIVSELGGEVRFDFASEGLRCFIRIPLASSAIREA